MRYPDRRTRLLAFIKPWAACRSAYVLRLGDYRIRHDALTDDALEGLASEICSRFWQERKHNRINRALRAGRAA